MSIVTGWCIKHFSRDNFLNIPLLVWQIDIVVAVKEGFQLTTPLRDISSQYYIQTPQLLTHFLHPIIAMCANDNKIIINIIVVVQERNRLSTINGQRALTLICPDEKYVFDNR